MLTHRRTDLVLHRPEMSGLKAHLQRLRHSHLLFITYDNVYYVKSQIDVDKWTLCLLLAKARTRRDAE